MYSVVIVAGGLGERLGSNRPKAFVGLAGKTLLEHSLAIFEPNDDVEAIALVVPNDWVDVTERIVDDFGCERVSAIVVGGASRAESVRIGLEALRGVDDAVDAEAVVLVHDAARPYVPEAMVARIAAGMADNSVLAAVPVVPVADTVKVADGDNVTTLDRSKLMRAQTPQAARLEFLYSVLSGMTSDELATVTDCSQAVEQAGGKIVTVEGNEKCLKITVPEDIQTMEAYFV